MEQLLPFLIVCPLVALAGFVDAIAGGGGLISLPAYLMTGMPPHAAIATNKLSSCMGTALATFRFAMKGYMRLQETLPCVLAALIGSALGAQLVLLVSDEPLRWIMLVIVPLTALYLLRPRSLHESDAPYPLRKTILVASVLSWGIGIYDGFYGPGTGTFLMMGFVALVHISVNQAAGLTKSVNLATNISALVVFLLHGQVWIVLGFVAGLFNVIGAWIGVNLFTGKGVKIVKPLMLVVLVLFFIKMLVELVVS